VKRDLKDPRDRWALRATPDRLVPQGPAAVKELLGLRGPLDPVYLQVGSQDWAFDRRENRHLQRE
jgi:hypothetical protein